HLSTEGGSAAEGRCPPVPPTYSGARQLPLLVIDELEPLARAARDDGDSLAELPQPRLARRHAEIGFELRDRRVHRLEQATMRRELLLHRYRAHDPLPPSCGQRATAPRPPSPPCP